MSPGELAVIHDAASLGLDHQVTRLLTGGPLDRALARIVVAGGVDRAEERAKRTAIYLNRAMAGERIDG